MFLAHVFDPAIIQMNPFQINTRIKIPMVFAVLTIFENRQM